MHELLEEIWLLRCCWFQPKSITPEDVISDKGIAHPASQLRLVHNLFCLAHEINNIIQLGTSNFLLHLWGRTVSFSSTVEFLPRSLHHPLASSYGSSKGLAHRVKPVDILAVRQTLPYVLMLKQLLLFRARYFCDLSPSKLQYMKQMHRAGVSHSYVFG